MFSINTIVLALATIAATATASPTDRGNNVDHNKVVTASDVAARCGDTKAFCCNNANGNVGALLPINVGDCNIISVLAVPIQKACQGSVCCSGQQNGLVNIQCFQSVL